MTKQERDIEQELFDKLETDTKGSKTHGRLKLTSRDIVEKTASVIEEYVEAEDEEIFGVIPGFFSSDVTTKAPKSHGILVITDKRLYFTGFRERMVQVRRVVGMRKKSESVSKYVGRHLIDEAFVSESGAGLKIELTTFQLTATGFTPDDTVVFGASKELFKYANRLINKINQQNIEVHNLGEKANAYHIQYTYMTPLSQLKKLVKSAEAGQKQHYDNAKEMENVELDKQKAVITKMNARAYHDINSSELTTEQQTADALEELAILDKSDLLNMDD